MIYIQKGSANSQLVRSTRLTKWLNTQIHTLFDDDLLICESVGGVFNYHLYSSGGVEALLVA